MFESNRISTGTTRHFFTMSGRGFIAVMGLLSTSVWAEQTQTFLSVQAGGFAHNQGQSIASLFRQGDDVFGAPYVRVTAPIMQGKSTLMFADIQPGDYALIVFHDENNNNDLDHNFLHLPAEPLGFSNGFELSLFSAMPSFEKLHFSYTLDSKPLQISVK